ncbi:glycosyltransferase [Secundilactobacillus mixtipabuli]|uniref:Glycosyl transferase n=1 Tax=Secundilactobacillus mixtipabuli TaxID=1435342 RepID=A0A1Z5IBR0_9LACO|nr:glycosyltransferase [Secundilactobacillus mixtipabuli]GAW99213.1 glycosyl transferase [Secundilactobacillus mixtipabuli]
MISIIMTIYKEPWEWLHSALESIINQSYQNIELIIVIDNPNYDDIDQLKNQLTKCNVKYICKTNLVNVGLVSSLNYGISLSTGDYIARMDSDDIACTDRLEKELEFLQKNNFDLISSDVKKIDERGNQIGNSYYTNNLMANDIKKIEKWQNVFWHPTWLGKRKVFEHLQGYRKIPFAEDYDFVIRALLRDYRLGQLSNQTVYKRVVSSSVSESKGLEQILIANELAKNYRQGKVMPLNYLTKIHINSNQSNRYKLIKKKFFNRKYLSIPRKIFFIGSLGTSKIGRIFLRNVLIQKIASLKIRHRKWG